MALAWTLSGAELQGELEVLGGFGQSSHPKQQRAGSGMSLGVGDGSSRQALDRSQPLRKRPLGDREGLALDVGAQLFLQLRRRDAKDSLAGLRKRRSIDQRIEQQGGLRRVLLLLTQQQIVHQRPRLGIEDRSLRALVVERRTMIDRNELVYRDELLAQQEHVRRVNAADEYLLAVTAPPPASGSTPPTLR